MKDHWVYIIIWDVIKIVTILAFFNLIDRGVTIFKDIGNAFIVIADKMEGDEKLRDLITFHKSDAPKN